MARKVAIEVTEAEIEFRSKEYPDVSVIKDGKLPCTVCFNDIKHVILLKEKVYQHVYLNVILCKFYGNGEFSADEDGLEKYCGWCGQGGNLYICSSCPHAFCKKCLKGNLGRQYFQTVEDSEWCCVFCQPEDLFKLRAQCWAVKQYLEENKTKPAEKEQERKSILNIELLDEGKDFSEQIKMAEKRYYSFLYKIKKIASELDKATYHKPEFENVEALKSIESLSLALSMSIKTSNATKKSIDSYLVRLNKRLQKASRKGSESDLSEHENQVSMKENGLKMKISLSPKKKIKQESENSEIENRENENGNDMNKNSNVKKESKIKIKKSPSDSENSAQETINKSCDLNKKSLINTENSAHKNVEKIKEDPLLDTSNFDLDSPPLEIKGNEGNSADEIFEDAESRPPIKLSLKTGRKSNNKSEIDFDSSDGDLVLKKETKKGQNSNKTPENEEHKKKNNLLSSSDDEMFFSKEEKDSDDKNSPEKAPTKKNLLSSDSSSTDPLASSDEDLKVKLKKKKEKGEFSVEAKKKSDAKKARKEKIKAEKESKATLSSSDEDLSKLLKIYNTKTLPKTSDKETSSDKRDSDGDSDKAPKKAKAKKSEKDELTLEDCLEEDGERVKPVYDLNFDYELDARKDQQLVKGLLDSDSNSSISDLGSIVTMSEEENDDKGKKKSSGKRNHSDSGSDNKERKKVYKDKLLTEKLSSEDTSEEERKWANNKLDDPLKSDDSADDFITKKKKKVTLNTFKKQKNLTQLKNEKKKVLSIHKPKKENLKKRKKMFSDSEESEIEAISSSSSSDVELLEEEEKTPKKRKRIRRRSSGSDSVDSEGNKKKAPDSDKKGRKNIRRVLKEDDLEKSTKEALRLEKERKERIKEKQKQYHQMMDFQIGEVKEITEVVLDFDPKTKEPLVSVNKDLVKKLKPLVLDFDPKTKEPLVSVNKDLVKKLKPHQVEGIKFMWDACFESLKDAKEKAGSGCVLAHCMGLGKTLQVITLIHTLLSNSECNINTVLVVTPVSTVLNWVSEFRKWLKDVGSGQDIEVFHFQRTDAAYRSHQLKEWHRCGGVMIMGYNLFRSLAQPTNRIKKSFRTTYAEKLLDPGPDLVICDEGHILKNESTAISKAMSKLKTRRRIVLTGTPLQNNLVEYHCMVQFVKPSLLGTKKEFKNRFVNPIVNGQFEDSTAYDVKIMKKRAHVLHTMLDGIVQRKDYNVLTPYLPPKFEYVLHIKMTDLQCKLYRHYLDNVVQTSLIRKRLFVDFQNLMRICVHPRALLMKAEKDELAREMRSDEDSEGSLKDFIDDGGDTDTSESSLATSKSGSDSEPVVVKPTRRTRQTANNNDVENEEEVTERKEWWSEIVTKEDFEDFTKSSKLIILFEILKECEICGDKLLIFSQSLFSLDIIEYFLNAVDDGLVEGYKARWIKGRDYFRLDGSTATDTRQNICKVFNADENSARLFLISTRAGGLGINLTGANRVILFDASWNPSYDVQSIFRIYRFGQTKPCYVYRFLSKGTMEEKIYERQVAKLSTALRVIDEHQIDRHFSHSALAELYTFDPEASELQGTPVLPKDYLMANLFKNHKEIILSYHQHDSLLENKEDQELTEEERKAAWDEYENEKNPPPQTQMFYDPNALALQQVNIITDMADKLKNQDPSLTAEQIDEKMVSILSSMPVFNISRERYFQLKTQAPMIKSMLANMLSMNNFKPAMGNFSGANMMGNNMQMRPQYQMNQMYQMNPQQQMMNRMQQQPFFPSTSKRGPQPPSAANSHFGVQRKLTKVNLPFPQTSTPKPQPNRQTRNANKPPEVVELD